MQAKKLQADAVQISFQSSSPASSAKVSDIALKDSANEGFELEENTIFTDTDFPVTSGVSGHVTYLCKNGIVVS